MLTEPVVVADDGSCSQITCYRNTAQHPGGGWFTFCYHCDADLGKYESRVHCENGCPMDNNAEARQRVLKMRRARNQRRARQQLETEAVIMVDLTADDDEEGDGGGGDASAVVDSAVETAREDEVVEISSLQHSRDVLRRRQMREALWEALGAPPEREAPLPPPASLPHAPSPLPPPSPEEEQEMEPEVEPEVESPSPPEPPEPAMQAQTQPDASRKRKAPMTDAEGRVCRF